MRAPALVVALAMCACGDDTTVAPDATVTPDAADATVADPSDELFRPDHVLDVRITMSATDWARMRAEPDTVGLPNGTCNGPAAVEPYSTFHAELVVDGVTFSDVGIRKKGNLGSLSATRPGMKIDVHEFVAAQRIFGLKHLTLNNNHQDDRRISQCLGYGLFAKAGLPASRCNFAHVTVNGEDLGVYSNVETLKDNFLRRNFGDDTGRLYESGGDFVAGATRSFQPKTNPTAPDCSDLEAVTTALAVPRDQRAASVGAVVDLAEFSRYWAMEVLTDHWDGYANNRNNSYLYHDPTSDRFKYIPWGLDALFEGRERTTRPRSVYACGSLTWRLYDAPETRAMYLAALRDVIANVWDEAAIVGEIDRMQSLIQPFETSDLAQRIQPIRDFVATRAAVLEAELAAGDPVWPYAESESCLPRIGTISGMFDTTWGTLGQFTVGSGSTTGTVSGTNVASSTVTIGAGLDEEGKAAMQVLAQLSDGRYAVVYLIVNDPVNFTVGAHPIDLATTAGFMLFYNPATDTASGGGLVLPGTLTLTNASMTVGGRVRGSFTGDVREL